MEDSTVITAEEAAQDAVIEPDVEVNTDSEDGETAVAPSDDTSEDEKTQAAAQQLIKGFKALGETSDYKFTVADGDLQVSCFCAEDGERHAVSTSLKVLNETLLKELLLQELVPEEEKD